MPKVSENAEGNFKLLNGEKIYLQRNEEGECYAFLNTIGTAYRNGTYAIGRKIVEGFSTYAQCTHFLRSPKEQSNFA